MVYLKKVRILMILYSKWSKEHVIRGITRVCDTVKLVSDARNMDAVEFGVYRGEATQLIDNMFYGYQFPVRRIWGIDSFEGLPAEADNVERFYLFNQGMFSDVTHLYPLRQNGRYIKKWFNELTLEDFKPEGLSKVCFVHIDGDLYQSCVDSLKFLFENDLVVPGTVIAYDEFKSTSSLESGGESLATFEACTKYKIGMTEFFRNVYNDNGIELWQNCFIINNIGEQNECRLLEP